MTAPIKIEQTRWWQALSAGLLVVLIKHAPCTVDRLLLEAARRNLDHIIDRRQFEGGLCQVLPLCLAAMSRLGWIRYALA